MILSQDEIIPGKLEDYLSRHSEIADKVSMNGTINFYVSDITPGYISASEKIYGDKINIQKSVLCAKENKYL